MVVSGEESGLEIFLKQPLSNPGEVIIYKFSTPQIGQSDVVFTGSQERGGTIKKSEVVSRTVAPGNEGMVKRLSFKVRIEVAAMESRVIAAEAFKPVDVACCAQRAALGF